MVTAVLKFLFLFLCLFGTASAHASPDSSDIHKILEQDKITEAGIELDREGLTEFYSARDFRPAWSFSGSDTQTSFNAFLDSLDKLVRYHGLQTADYPIDTMRKMSGDGVILELFVTDTLLHIAHDLHGDDVDLDHLYVGWDWHQVDRDIPVELAGAIKNNRLSAYVDELSPKFPAYGQLAHVLEIYRAVSARGGWSKVERGASLRPGDSGVRVKQLRARLAAEDFLPSDNQSPMFDEELENALITWQTRHGLEPDGHAGGKTIEALNVTVQKRIGQIRANMQRWRHMPADFPPDRYVLVNIGDTTVTITENGKAIYRGPVVVGKVDRKTPFINSEIRSVIVNPSWHVPAKIAEKDILPKLRKDPHYLEKLGFTIRGSEDDPYGENIDWNAMSARAFVVRLRQDPGEMNSLGRLKFDFDNDFAVYMHGTPHQELFAKYARYFSSGCVRLRDPGKVGAIILSSNKDAWPIDRIDREIDTGKTRWVNVTHPWPIYFLYWTVFTDADGMVNFREDIYDYDKIIVENQLDR